MQEERLGQLLGTEEVAEYLGVGQVTVYRWCREGSLPCLKIGRRWRVRREALEEFVRRSERSQTLTGRLRAFLEVPDNVMAISQNRQLMHRLDAAFFRVGEPPAGAGVARGDGVAFRVRAGRKPHYPSPGPLKDPDGQGKRKEQVLQIERMPDQAPKRTKPPITLACRPQWLGVRDEAGQL